MSWSVGFTESPWFVGETSVGQQIALAVGTHRARGAALCEMIKFVSFLERNQQLLKLTCLTAYDVRYKRKCTALGSSRLPTYGGGRMLLLMLLH